MILNDINAPYLDALYRINSKKRLGRQRAFKSFLSILLIKSARQKTAVLASFLTGLFCNWITSEELSGILNAIRIYEWKDFISEKIKLNKKVISIVWSGKKWFKTFNISTAASLIASCCGATVAKIWSSATSSLTGSRDILTCLWAKSTIPQSKIIWIINNLNFWFFPIEESIPKFDKIYWWIFYAPHILSYILPALVSPVYLDGIVYWIAWNNLEITKELLYKYKFPSFSIVSSQVNNIHFIDEISWIWFSKIIRYHNKEFSRWIHCFYKELGLYGWKFTDIQQWISKEENIQFFLNSISNSWNIHKNYIVALNASELLLMAWIVKSFKEGFYKSMEAIKSNKPLKLLQEYIKSTWWKFIYS